MSNLLVEIVSILEIFVVAWHDENDVEVSSEIWIENRLDHSISKYLQLGQTLLTLFFRDFDLIHSEVMSESNVLTLSNVRRCFQII